MTSFKHLFQHTRHFAFAALLGSSLALVGCGGGGADGGHDDGNEEDPIIEDPIVVTPVPQITNVDLASTPELDGVVFGNNLDQTARPDLAPHIGDFAFTNQTGGAQRLQAYFSYDLSSIPEGATIRSATLSVYVFQVVDGDPQGMMALVDVDHVAYQDQFPQNFTPIVLDGLIGQLTDINTLGRKEVDVTAQLQADLDAGRSRSQYRVKGRLDSDFDNENDAVEFTDGEDSRGTGQLPLLRIEYEL